MQQLTQNIINDTRFGTRAYGNLKRSFDSFQMSSEWLLNKKDYFPGFEIDASGVSESFDACYAGVRVRFKFYVAFDNERLVGRVLVTKEAPKVTESVVVIGSFTFGPNGICDICSASDPEGIDLAFCGHEIILHFWNLALRKEIV